MRPTKIFLVIPGINRGSDKFALRLAKELEKKHNYRFVVLGRWFGKFNSGIKYKLYDTSGDAIYGWYKNEKKEMIEYIKRKGPYDLVNTHTATIVLDGDLDSILSNIGKPPVVFVPHGSFVVRLFYREFLPYVDYFEKNPKETIDDLLSRGAKPGGYNNGGKGIEKELKDWWTRSESKLMLETFMLDDRNHPYPWQKWWLLGFFHDLERETIKRSNKIVHVSNWIKEMFDKIYGNEHSEKAEVILDGVHYPQLTKEKRDEISRWFNHFNNLYGRNGVKVWYVFLGAFAPEKGIFDILSAYVKLRQKGRNVGLILIGGTSNNKMLDYIVAIGRVVKNLHIYSPNFGSKLNDTQLAGLLLALSYLNKGVYVHPAWVEDFGLAPLEAAYFGLPVIVYNHKGLKEVIVQNGLGVGVEPYNIEELAQKMEEVGDNIEKYKNYNNTQLIERKYSLDRAVDDYHELFSKLIKR